MITDETDNLIPMEDTFNPGIKHQRHKPGPTQQYTPKINAAGKKIGNRNGTLFNSIDNKTFKKVLTNDAKKITDKKHNTDVAKRTIPFKELNLNIFTLDEPTTRPDPYNICKGPPLLAFPFLSVRKDPYFEPSNEVKKGAYRKPLVKTNKRLVKGIYKKLFISNSLSRVNESGIIEDKGVYNKLYINQSMRFFNKNGKKYSLPGSTTAQNNLKPVERWEDGVNKNHYLVKIDLKNQQIPEKYDIVETTRDARDLRRKIKLVWTYRIIQGNSWLKIPDCEVWKDYPNNG